MQQDAQEFLNYLLNTIAEILTEEAQQQPRLSAPAARKFMTKFCNFISILNKCLILYFQCMASKTLQQHLLSVH